MPPSAQEPGSRPLQSALVLLSLWFLASFLYVSTRRVLYPYDLEWIEGSLVIAAERLARGEALYAPSGASYIALPYPPLYFATSAVAVRALGPGYLPLRAVSLAASLTSLVLLARWLHRRGGALAVVVGGGIWAGTYALSDYWFELARVDPLYLALTLASFERAAWARRVPGLAAGLLLALAFLTKQTAALFAPALVLALALERGRRPAATCAVTFAAVSAAALAGLHLASAGWSTHYLFRVHAHDEVDLVRLVTKGPGEVMTQLPAAIVLALVWALWRRRAGFLRGDRAALLAGAASLVATAVQRGNLGGWWNVHMATHLFAALLAGLVLADLEPLRAWTRERARYPVGTLVHAALALQLLLLVRDPSDAVPGASRRAAKERFIAELRALGSPLLVPDHPYDAVQAGSPPCYHRYHLEDSVLRVGLPLPADLVDAVARGEYAAIVYREGLFPPMVPYRRLRRLGPGEREALRMPSGVWADPAAIFVPR